MTIDDRRLTNFDWGVFQGLTGGVDLDFEGFKTQAIGDEVEVAVALGFGIKIVLGLDLAAVKPVEAVEGFCVEFGIGDCKEGDLLEKIGKAVLWISENVFEFGVVVELMEEVVLFAIAG